ncbi:MAG: peptide chain release factor N(5)-glutamine methyltransferase [Candidatus Electronema sp. V4]|uniref:peptide chain release factor N(5)-glutamine methyltransferase n=1 Tax=Candidatus Electronema sp. V4 TaxID=3454756 RepID=UPI004055797B
MSIKSCRGEKSFAPTIHQTLKDVAEILAEAGVEDSALEAELLLRHCLSVSRSGLFLRQHEEMPPEQAAQLHALLARRCQREPLQHIIGSCEFWGMDFLVSPAVLIPRPETEFLLEHVFSTLNKENFLTRQALDLCTGSGVIAAVLAKELPEADVTASDCSLAALAVAQANLRRHRLENRVHLLCADLLAAFRSAPLFDLIVSNPPYIRAGDIPLLQPEVRDWEPHLALSGGPSGMEIIELICAQAAWLLRPGGWLFMEIGADIAAETEAALRREGIYKQVKVLPDWAGRPRVAQGRVNSSG